MSKMTSLVVAASSLVGIATAQGPACCPEGSPTARRVLEITFLYLDLSVCERCQDTGRNLEEAVALLRPAFLQAGCDLRVRKIHVTTREQAEKLRFGLSPTVRVNGRDIDLHGKKGACGDCSELGSCAVECRVWSWQGQVSTTPPTGLLVDALLRAYGAEPASEPETAAIPFELPGDMKRFFAARQDAGSKAGAACCPEDASATSTAGEDGKPAKHAAAGGSCCEPGPGCCSADASGSKATTGASPAPPKTPKAGEPCCEPGCCAGDAGNLRKAVAPAGGTPTGSGKDDARSEPPAGCCPPGAEGAGDPSGGATSKPARDLTCCPPGSSCSGR